MNALVSIRNPDADQASLGGPHLHGTGGVLVATQAVGLYWLGRRQELGLWVHAALGVLWPLGAGIAQLPVILAEGRYRAALHFGRVCLRDHLRRNSALPRELRDPAFQATTVIAACDHARCEAHLNSK